MLTATVEEPTENADGTFSFDGPHSSPGEYPHKETGQLVENLDYGVDRDQLAARWGVRGEDTGFQFPGNEHAGGEHWVWLANRGWRGMDDLHMELLSEAEQWFFRGVRNA